MKDKLLGIIKRLKAFIEDIIKDLEGEATPAPTPVPTPTPIPTPVPTPPPVPPTPPIESYNRVKVKLEEASRAKGEFKKFLEQALVYIEDVVNSKEFYSEVMKAKFTERRGDSNQKIYNEIISGNSIWETGSDKVLNYRIKIYYDSSSMVYGYVQDGDHNIYINSYYYSADMTNLDSDALGIWALANTLMHERGHTLEGGGHPEREDGTGYSHYETFEGSVPYTIGAITEKLVRRLVKGEKLTPLDTKSDIKLTYTLSDTMVIA